MRPLVYIEQSLRSLPSGTGRASVTLDRTMYETLRRDALAMLVACETQQKSDRPLLLQMASTIAAGIIANPNVCNWGVPPGSDITENLAEAAVGVANAIIARVDAQK